jgi:hemoglobin
MMKLIRMLKNYFLLLRWSRRKKALVDSNPMFERIGGMKVVEKLVDDFYQIMRTDPAAMDCWSIHDGLNMDETILKLKYFLAGWLGGPQLYLEKFGHPRLRMRHNHFVIGAREAEQWLYCMKGALGRSHIPFECQSDMMKAFSGIAQMLINQS